MNEPNESPSPELLTVNGSSVAVWRCGDLDGWPLIWHHGGLVCGMDALLLDEAARRCNTSIYSIDRPGIGYSDWRDTPTMAHWPETVEGVADYFDLRYFAVAGWSGGGPHALACAAALPGRVRAVATVAGMAPLRDWREVLELGLWADRVLILAAGRWPGLTEAALGLLRYVPEPYLRWEVRRLCSGPRDLAALDEALPTLIAATRESTRRGSAGMAAEYRRYGCEWIFELGDFHQPVTVWQGQDDTGLPMKHAQRLAASLPNSRLRTVSETGHGLPLVAAEDILNDLAP